MENRTTNKRISSTSSTSCDQSLMLFLLQIDNGGLLFGYQLAGGLFIVAWSFVLCSVVFLALWFFPVKIILTCLPWSVRLQQH